MTQFFFIIAILFALATLGFLLFGVGRMSQQGVENAKKSNKLMRYRILFQGLAVLALFLLAMAASS
ncbi:HIG1 domain-containing protein [Temperatibacter marinus]|uniref:HIG1 domain-containing protein n=1 Tax=Temperatibacter marinus TaxID=1456591 RepID=A0AA52EIX2_9PROT|nr:HIG1 domain-containing protein [Temperatibacter marinus]WND03993.1 HIG1 domain-containing protein [Temperatibacter marinus]